MDVRLLGASCALMREAPFGLYFLKWGLRPGEAPETQALGGVEEVLALLSRLPGASVRPEPGDIARFPHMALEGAWLKSPAPRRSVLLSREGRALAFVVLGAPVRCIAGPGPRELSLLARELGLEQRMGIVDAKARAWRPLDRTAAWRSPPPPAPAPEPPAPPPPPALSPFGPFRPRWSRHLGEAGLMLEKLVLTPSAVLACGHGQEVSEVPVSVGGNRVAVALGPGRVGVLDSADGRVLWSRELSRSSQPRCLFHHEATTLRLLHELQPPLWWQLPVAVDARHWLLPLRAEAPHQKPALQLLRVDTFEAIEVPLPGTPAVPVTLVADGPEAVFLSCGPTVTACRFDGGESMAAPGSPG